MPAADGDEGAEDIGKAAKKAKKAGAEDAAIEGERPGRGSAGSAGEVAPEPSTSAPAAEPRTYPPAAPRKGNVSLLLFYAYCKPQMTKGEDAFNGGSLPGPSLHL